jgi:ATP-dependent DNA helicase RecG
MMRFVESKHIEYKRELSETLEKEVVAFLNSGEGGVIHIGINAIVHNDYSYEAPPKFELFSDRMEITSTGGLPFGLAKDDFFSGVSVPRNKELMRVFKDLELVEYLGSGIPRILQKYDASVFQLTDNFLRIAYPYEEGFDQDHTPGITNTTAQVTAEGIADEGVNGGVKTVLAFIRNNPLGRVPAIAKGTGIPQKTIERYMKKLKEQGKIEFTGAPKTGGYRLIVGKE